MHKFLRRRRWLVGALAIVVASVAAAVLHAQNRFDIYLLAFDDKGLAVTDLELKEFRRAAT